MPYRSVEELSFVPDKHILRAKKVMGLLKLNDMGLAQGLASRLVGISDLSSEQQKESAEQIIYLLDEVLRSTIEE